MVGSGVAVAVGVGLGVCVAGGSEAVGLGATAFTMHDESNNKLRSSKSRLRGLIAGNSKG